VAYTAAAPEGIGYDGAGPFAHVMAGVPLLALIGYFWWVTRRPA
jgi:hypothetical protein